ncbi:hypothetical protein EZ449_02975 [Pedobacter frigidisoli]|uniref:Uncharacterized protein n=1 Tax=Pedobacter frigidisoli TaxID=2530455 RepID=A0A4R0P5W9_9SPHI|nr:hypothetical protein [Pedobacter frigidisoli]TCD12007.1 hypothetical protein EZ449_02975 [Pedobacter frigidisoli]
MQKIDRDKEVLIDYSINMAKVFIRECQEFYPFAATIGIDGELIPLLNYDGNEFSSSVDVLLDLNNLLNSQLGNTKRAYALAYDVSITKNEKKSDALAVKIKHLESEEVVIYYFSYVSGADNNVEILDSWGEIQ